MMDRSDFDFEQIEEVFSLDIAARRLRDHLRRSRKGACDLCGKVERLVDGECPDCRDQSHRAALERDLAAALIKEQKRDEDERIEEARKMDYLKLAVIAAGVAVAGSTL